MPKITNISFGSIAINGRKYDTDLTIFWDGEVLERGKSHLFSKRDMLDIMLKDPEMIVVGTGLAGGVKVEQAVLDLAKLNNVELIVKQTKEAVKDFNDAVRKKRVAAVMHITE